MRYLCGDGDGMVVANGRGERDKDKRRNRSGCYSPLRRAVGSSLTAIYYHTRAKSVVRRGADDLTSTTLHPRPLGQQLNEENFFLCLPLA